MQPRVIQVATAPKQKQSPRKLYAQVCYFYPQYTLAQARKLPARDVALLLREAAHQEAARNYSLTQIVAAPHSEKGEAIGQLLDHFGDLMDG